MSSVQTALRYGMRRGWERGVLDGNSAWVVVGGIALVGYLAGRALRARPETVFSQLLEPGEVLRITHEAFGAGALSTM